MAVQQRPKKKTKPTKRSLLCSRFEDEFTSSVVVHVVIRDSAYAAGIKKKIYWTQLRNRLTRLWNKFYYTVFPLLTACVNRKLFITLQPLKDNTVAILFSQRHTGRPEQLLHRVENSPYVCTPRYLIHIPITHIQYRPRKKLP